MTFDPGKTVDVLTEARIRHSPFGKLPPGFRPESESQGYRVQSLLHECLNQQGLGPRAGYKIGCTTKIMQQYLDIDQPCAGGIMKATIHAHDSEISFDDYCRVGVECEIAIRMARDTPVTANELTEPSDIAPFVGACMAAIEIVDDRYLDYKSMDTPTLIADDFFGAGCVLSGEISDWHTLDLSALHGRMDINGRCAGQGTGDAILGHPLNALCWLVGHLSRTGAGLKAGDIVLLGSIVRTQWLNRGDSVSVTVQGLGTTGAKFL